MIRIISDDVVVLHQCILEQIVELLEEKFDDWGLDEGKKTIMREIVLGGRTDD